MAGFYCAINADTDSDATQTHAIGSEINGKCPKGYYCPLGTVAPLPCPIGTYSDTEQNDDVADCLPCTAGHYCDEMGLTLADLSNKECFEGFICLTGSDIPNPKDGVKGKLCDPGHYCSKGSSAMTQCPPGSYEP